MSDSPLKVNDVLDLLALRGEGVRIEPTQKRVSCRFVQVAELAMCLVTGPKPNQVRQVVVNRGSVPGLAATLKNLATLVPVTRSFRPSAKLMVGPAGGFGENDPSGELAEGRDPGEVVAAVEVFVGCAPGGLAPGSIATRWQFFFPLEGEEGIKLAVAGIAANDPTAAYAAVRRYPAFSSAMQTAQSRYGV